MTDGGVSAMIRSRRQGRVMFWECKGRCTCFSTREIGVRQHDDQCVHVYKSILRSVVLVGHTWMSSLRIDDVTVCILAVQIHPVSNFHFIVPIFVHPQDKTMKTMTAVQKQTPKKVVLPRDLRRSRLRPRPRRGSVMEDSRFGIFRLLRLWGHPSSLLFRR